MNNGMIAQLILSVAGICFGAAQLPQHNLGRPATPEEIRKRDISVAPDGTGLPVGHGSVKEGRQIYKVLCGSCHGDRGQGFADYPPLVGGQGTLKSKDPVFTIGSYWPYATTVWDYTHRAMLRISIAVVAALMGATNGWGQSGTASGMRVEAITDPVLNLTAFNVTVPAKWHFAGRLLQGTTCSPVPYPVFRATSPDGLTVLERLPRMDWIWGNGPGSGASSNCLPLKREMSANEFVKYMAVMLKADYVSDDPFPADVIAATNKGFAESKLANAAKYRAAGMNPPEEHTDMDRAVVRFKNGSFMMKGQIAVSIYCSGNKSRPIGNLPIVESHSCQANVRYVHAVEEQYPAMVKMLENHLLLGTTGTSC